MYADGLYNSMIDNKDGYIPSPLIMFTCTALCHAFLQWQKNKRVHLKASKSKLKADRPEHSNYFNYMNDGGMIASCCGVTGDKLLTSPDVAYTYTFLMNIWNILPESYQQRVYKNTLATVKSQIQPAENQMAAVVIRVEAAHVDNAILLDYVSSQVELEETEIRSTDRNIPIENIYLDDELHFGMPGRSGDYGDEADESDECDILSNTSWQRRPATEPVSLDLWTSDVDRYEGEDCDNVDADEVEEALQADNRSTQNVEDWEHSSYDLGTSNVNGYEGEDGEDVDEEEEALQPHNGSTQNVEDWGHSTREFDDWTVYFSSVKYDNGEANATPSDVSEAKTVL